MNNEIQFELADFIPYYVDTASTDESRVYPSLSSSKTFYESILAKQEFSSLRLTSATEHQRPYEDSPFFNHQEFVARFLSPHTPYNRFLAIHGVGSGKCIHPHSMVYLASPVSIFDKTVMISHLWNTLGGGMIIYDKENGEWSYPKEPVYVISLNPTTQQLERKRVIRFYREYVKTTLMKYTQGSDTLLCTHSHKLYTKNGFQSKVIKGTPVMKLQYSNTSVCTTTYQPLTYADSCEYYDGYVYDLEVEDHHNYIANSFVTHNTCLLTAVGERARQLNPNLKHIYVITKPGLTKNTIYEISEKCTKGKYNLSEKEKEGLTDEAIEKERQKRVFSAFDILTLNDFAKEEVGSSVELLPDGSVQARDEELYEKFNNCYIIVDEAHNIIPTKKDKPSTNNYEILKYIVHNVKGIKLLLLTATPMSNEPVEMVPLLNLLLPSTKQIKEKTSSSFEKRWYNKDNKFIDGNKFIRDYLIGNISYLRSRIRIHIDYKGETLPKRNILFTKVVPIIMDPHQSSVCLRELKKDQVKMEDDVDSYGLATVSRQCSNFVFPDGSILSSGEVKWVTLEESETSKIKSFRCNNAFRQYLQANGTDRESMLLQIKKCSIKMEYIIRIILDHPHEKIFVYSEYIRGGGCILLAALLQEFGYEDFPKRVRDVSGISKTKRFVVFSSDTRTSSKMSEDIDRKRKILNHYENRYGDYVQVIIGGGTVTEGVSFFHIRHMFALTPTWNMAEMDQAIGRAIRLDSHDALPPEQQSISIYRLCALLHPSDATGEKGDMMSIDERMYYVSEIKDIKIKQLERLLKVAAIDCSNNKIQNELLLTDIINSRECNYGECRYVCYPEELQQTTIKPISDTYNLLYGESETEIVIRIVKELFSIKFYYDFYELLQQIRSSSIDGRMKTLSSILLARSLYKIIVDNVVIINKHGFPNYLREDRNLYFLTDDPSGSVFYTLGWYASNPYPDVSYAFDDAMIMYLNQNYPKVIRLLQQHLSDPETVKIVLSNCPSLIAEQLIEQSFLVYPTKSPSSMTPLHKTLYSIYDKFIIRSGPYLLHKILNRYRVYSSDTKEWSTISSEQYNQLKSSSEQKPDYSINKPLADKIRLQGYIPLDHTDHTKFDELKIKRLSSIKGDARYDGDHRGGTKCSTGVMYNRAKCLELMIELVRLSQQYNLIMPLDNITNTTSLSLHEDYRDIVNPGIVRWDIYNQISKQLIDQNNVLEMLFPLKNVLQKKNRNNFCKILDISLEDREQQDLASTSLWKDGQMIKKEYTQTEVIDALKEYSEVNSVLIQLYERIFKRPYDQKLNVSNQLDKPMVEVLSKAVLLTGKELCKGIGRWFEKNGLLGIS